MVDLHLSAGNTEPGKKLGGRHGMVFGHVQQPTATQPPQMPGKLFELL